ncbi:hypothetical protein D0B32_07330 [Paraburkholderia sp. DHOC27]|nr:hypothetical protein D0B32_07330 [Paraburkholderia sp. DHOC27]
MSAKESVGSLPLMVAFRRPLPERPLQYEYDEQRQLNVVHVEGRTVPAVQLPDVRLRMKTNQYRGGED